MGAGMEVITRAFAGHARPAAFLIKILLTAITLGAGFKGGEIVPALFAGATFGAFYGSLFGIPTSFAAGIGLSVLLAYELFGGEGLPLIALACAVAYMLSGYSGLYHAQKILYSKMRPEYIAR